LTSLVHVTAIPASQTQNGVSTPTAATAALVAWVFQEMKDRAVLSLRDLGTTLAQMPSGTAPDSPTAGAPFGMPYTLALPDRERWQSHLDLLASAAALTAVLADPAQDDPQFPIFAQARAKLAGLADADKARVEEIKPLLKNS